MHQVLCSTGALLGRPNNRDFTLLESLSKQLDCDGYELMVYESWYPRLDELVACLQKLSLNIPIVHCDKNVGTLLSVNAEENVAQAHDHFVKNCRVAKEVSADRMVLHLWGGLASDRCIEGNLGVYPLLRDTAASFGLDLLVENVVCNQQDPMTHLCELHRRHPHVGLTYDTKMAAFHSQVEQLFDLAYHWLWKDGCIRHYHLNDYRGGHMDWANLNTAPIGEGKVPFRQVFEHILASGYAGDFTCEVTAFDKTGAVDTDMLNRQFRLIREGLGL